mmetsp:Transcript_908/g.1949  ORF Transcript_908/g.1949 Transcript_908/m.1949 type:complete len:263 (-) Transcript_908:371-1159(-)
MPLSAAERKRKSRASNPQRNLEEREKSRKRMAIFRAKKKSQKKVGELKALLRDGELKELETQSAKRKISLLREWMISRDLNLTPEVIIERNITNLFVPKIEMHKIEHELAEFELSLAQKLMCAPKPEAVGSLADCVEESEALSPDHVGIVGKEAFPQGIDRFPSLPIPENVQSSTTSGSFWERRIDLIPQGQGQNYDHFAGGNPDEEKGSYPSGHPRMSIASSGDVSDNATKDEKGQRQCTHEIALDALLMAAERIDSEREI